MIGPIMDALVLAVTGIPLGYWLLRRAVLSRPERERQ